MREYRVWSIEYRERLGSKGDRKPDNWLGAYFEDRRPGGHVGRMVLAPGFRRLKAERLTPERPTTVAVTRHLE
jgi:hypothetical protein